MIYLEIIEIQSNRISQKRLIRQDLSEYSQNIKL